MTRVIYWFYQIIVGLFVIAKAQTDHNLHTWCKNQVDIEKEIYQKYSVLRQSSNKMVTFQT